MVRVLRGGLGNGLKLTLSERFCSRLLVCDGMAGGPAGRALGLGWQVLGSPLASLSPSLRFSFLFPSFLLVRWLTGSGGTGGRWELVSKAVRTKTAKECIAKANSGKTVDSAFKSQLNPSNQFAKFQEKTQKQRVNKPDLPPPDAPLNRAPAPAGPSASPSPKASPPSPSPSSPSSPAPAPSPASPKAQAPAAAAADWSAGEQKALEAALKKYGKTGTHQPNPPELTPTLDMLGVGLGWLGWPPEWSIVNASSLGTDAFLFPVFSPCFLHETNHETNLTSPLEADRWDKISADVGRPKADCVARFKHIVSLMKSAKPS